MKNDYRDIADPSTRVQQVFERAGMIMASVGSSTVVNEFPHKGQILTASVSLAGERRVDFESSYKYEWVVRIQGSDKIRSIHKQKVEVEVALAEDRGVFEDWAPKEKTKSGPSASVGAGVPAVGSFSVGGSRGAKLLIESRRADLNRLYWAFHDVRLSKDDSWRAVLDGTFTTTTLPKPLYAGGVSKVPEFFPIRFLIRLAFEGERRVSRLYVSREKIVMMPSFVFLLNRVWKRREKHGGIISAR